MDFRVEIRRLQGFRALAAIENGRAQLISRNGHPFASFSALAEAISHSLPNARAVIDGEICSLDRRGKPQFKNLLFRRGNPPCFFAFDLLTRDGKDWRTERLIDRKQELRRLLAKTSPLSLTICGACRGFSLCYRRAKFVLCNNALQSNSQTRWSPRSTGHGSRFSIGAEAVG